MKIGAIKIIRNISFGLTKNTITMVGDGGVGGSGVSAREMFEMLVDKKK
jgi:predicted transcriptional regulator